MAATGYTPIYLYYSSTATNAPAAGNLGYGELAINITDGYLYYKDNANAIQKIGYKLVPTTNGGTGLTSFIANGVVYASSTSALTTGTALQFDGSNLGVNVASSAWNSTYRAIELAKAGNGVYCWNGGGLTGLVAGAYLDSGYAWKYALSSQAIGKYEITETGNHIWSISASGTAGNTVTWTNAARLFPTGGYTFGGTTDPGAGNVRIDNGNLVIGTSGKGIDFSATAGTGTSELFADYEEGTFTPTVTSQTGSITTYSATGVYTKVGNTITVQVAVTLTNVGTAAGVMFVNGLPFTSKTVTGNSCICLVRETNNTGTAYQGIVLQNNTYAQVSTLTNGAIAWTNTNVYTFCATYQTA